MVGEVEEFLKECNIPDHKVWAMPAGDDRESLMESYGPVMNFVRDRGWRYTGRSILWPLIQKDAFSMKFKDTIGIYDNVFTKLECKALVNRFEEAHKEGLSYTGMSGDGGVNDYKKSNDYNILDTGREIDAPLSNLVLGKFK